MKEMPLPFMVLARIRDGPPVWAKALSRATIHHEIAAARKVVEQVWIDEESGEASWPEGVDVRPWMLEGRDLPGLKNLLLDRSLRPLPYGPFLPNRLQYFVW